MNPPATSQQHVLDWLRHAIVAGDLVPGQKVAQELVAERTGVSVVPVREALRTLEQEGQLRYLPRRGYQVTELRIEDLEEIYALRQVLEERAARHALPLLDAVALDRMQRAADDCAAAVSGGDVSAELEANRRFHFAILDAADRPHSMRVIRGLWDATEGYRALYYNDETERRAAVAAHDRIMAAVHAQDAHGLVAELDEHRSRALTVLRAILA